MMLLLIAQATDQPTVNPNTGDAWLGRLYLLALILATFVGLYKALGINGRFHAAMERAAAAAVQPLSASLSAHTNEEAGLVRREIDAAIAPLASKLDRLDGRMDQMTLDRQLAIQTNDINIHEIRERVSVIESRSQS